MPIQKLKKSEKLLRLWRIKRERKARQIMDLDKRIGWFEALSKAAQLIGPAPR